MSPRRSLSSAPTIRDVARAAGVSTATASRVVRGEDKVRPEKVAAVERAVLELGYVPNSAARGLVERRVGAVALVFPEREGRVFTDPFFGAAVSGVSSALDNAGLQLLLVMTGSDDSGERMRRFVRGNHCDGIVLASQHEESMLDMALAELMAPVVSIGKPPRQRDMPYVDLDNPGGGQLAAEHLLESGRKRIALIGGPHDMAAARERAAGFEAELARHGVTLAGRVDGDYSYASGARAFDRLVEDVVDLDAVFAVNDLMAFAAIQRAKAQGLSVPGDLAVMGFDDIDVARAEAAGLTTVHNPVRTMSAQATRTLLTLIDGGDVAERMIAEPRLVLRTTA